MKKISVLLCGLLAITHAFILFPCVASMALS